MKDSNNKGFALLGLVISVVIIAVLVMLYYRKSENTGPSPHETNEKAIQEAENYKASELQRQIEIQNELNSIGR